MRLEQMATKADLAQMATKADLAQMATKADVAEKVAALQVEMNKGFADMVKWVVGVAIAFGATGLTVITFVLNNATLKPVQLSAPAPIIIYAQPAVAAPAKFEFAPESLPSKK